MSILCLTTIGVNCNICDRCFIENNVIIGDNVTIKSVSLWSGLIIEDGVFIGPGYNCNDKYPKSKNYVSHLYNSKTGCSIGSGSTILPGITIGKNAMIGAGSVVTRCAEYTTVIGNPQRI